MSEQDERTLVVLRERRDNISSVIVALERLVRLDRDTLKRMPRLARLLQPVTVHPSPAA